MLFPSEPFNELKKFAALSNQDLYKSCFAPFGRIDAKEPGVVSQEFFKVKGLSICQLIVEIPPLSYVSLIHFFIFLKGTPSILFGF